MVLPRFRPLVWQGASQASQPSISSRQQNLLLGKGFGFSDILVILTYWGSVGKKGRDRKDIIFPQLGLTEKQ